MIDFNEQRRRYAAALCRIRPRPPTAMVSLGYNIALGGSGPRSMSTSRDCRAAPATRRPLRGNLSADRVMADLKALDAAVHRTLINRRLERISYEKRLFWIAAVESPFINPHIHMVWWINHRDQLLPFLRLWGSSRLNDIWRTHTGSGESDAVIIHDPSGWPDYLLKQAPELQPDDTRLTFAPQVWPSHCRPKVAA